VHHVMCSLCLRSVAKYFGFYVVYFHYVFRILVYYVSARMFSFRVIYVIVSMVIGFLPVFNVNKHPCIFLFF
jgi:hypothetical protein